MTTIKNTGFENYKMHEFIKSVNKYMQSINQNLDLSKACVHNVSCLKVNTGLKPSQIIYNEHFNQIKNECEITPSDDGNIVFIYNIKKGNGFLIYNFLLMLSLILPIIFEYFYTNYIITKWKLSTNSEEKSHQA